MKKKKERKLVLNKTTIANLNNLEMMRLHGGGATNQNPPLCKYEETDWCTNLFCMTRQPLCY